MSVEGPSAANPLKRQTFGVAWARCFAGEEKGQMFKKGPLEYPLKGSQKNETMLKQEWFKPGFHFTFSSWTSKRFLGKSTTPIVAAECSRCQVVLVLRPIKHGKWKARAFEGHARDQILDPLWKEVGEKLGCAPRL